MDGCSVTLTVGGALLLLVGRRVARIVGCTVVLVGCAVEVVGCAVVLVGCAVIAARNVFFGRRFGVV